MFMTKEKSKVFGIVVLSVAVVFVLSGCAQTMRAIEHAKMTVAVKMSDTIFLDPTILTKNRNVFVRVTNTSDMQEIV
ncbi:complement resistance protein TraT, partial [Dissulfurispira sp.]|uniref:complement resistance protein TraT n=1 Tax=Dissulfurispira sp. TaxID=2817609 RepID=UPI002FDB39EB